MAFLLLIAAGFAAGIINSVAGGGSFLTFPSLVFAGIPPVVSNASSTVALVPATLTSAWGYRADIQGAKERKLLLWLFVSLIAGAAGAVLLLRTPDRAFRQIAPWLLLLATLTFAFGRRISIALGGRLHRNNSVMLLILFPIFVYGGYFGGGMGIMILAAFRLFGLTDIHAMNGMKTILGGSLNAIAAFIFITSHHVRWIPTLLVMASATAGGYVGPKIARRASPSMLRAIVIAVGAAMTGYFFYLALR